MSLFEQESPKYNEKKIKTHGRPVVNGVEKYLIILIKWKKDAPGYEGK